PLTVPAVIRLGGNAEERAIAIMERVRGHIPAPLEAYGKDDSPDFCAGRLRALIGGYTPPAVPPPGWRQAEPQQPYTFETVSGGTVILDHARCRDCASKVCVETCAPQILSLDDDVPVLNITREQAQRGGCTECLACQVECYFAGNRGGTVDLPIAGLDAWRDQAWQQQAAEAANGDPD
ncbi:MAG: hypothetical protein JW910_23375, partial [Anaerolineae bacterium]|nr:hypothetical protein [Anaerolineae bacterium]